MLPGRLCAQGSPVPRYPPRGGHPIESRRSSPGQCQSCRIRVELSRVDPLDPYRLPRTVIPSRYDLTLEPNLQTARFTGTVTIAMDMVEPVDTVWLNAAELAITAAAIEDTTGQRRPIAEVTLHEAQERVQLGLGALLPAGADPLPPAFAGPLNSQPHPLYPPAL